MKSVKSIACAIMLVGGSTAASAQATDKAAFDISGASVEALMTYAMPLALAGYSKACSGELSGGGFFLKNETRLMTKFESAAEGSWPAARDALKQFAKADEDFDAIMEMDEDSVRPFIDGIIKLKIAEEIDATSCSEIERLLETLDPLPARNIAALVGQLVDLTR